jgi:hypothetical protein
MGIRDGSVMGFVPVPTTTREEKETGDDEDAVLREAEAAQRDAEEAAREAERKAEKMELLKRRAEEVMAKRRQKAQQQQQQQQQVQHAQTSIHGPTYMPKAACPESTCPRPKCTTHAPLIPLWAQGSALPRSNLHT